MAAVIGGSGGMSATLSVTNSAQVSAPILGRVRRPASYRRPIITNISLVAAGQGSMAAAGTLGVAAEMAASIEGAGSMSGMVTLGIAVEMAASIVGSGSMSGTAAMSVSDDEECTALALLYLFDLAA